MVVEGYYQFIGVVGQEVLSCIQVVAVLEIDGRPSLAVINSVFSHHVNLLQKISDEFVPTDACT